MCTPHTDGAYSNVYNSLVGSEIDLTLDWTVLQKFRFKEMVGMLGKNMFLCSEKKQETSNRHSELHFDILRQISFEFENWGSEKYNVNNELHFF